MNRITCASIVFFMVFSSNVLAACAGTPATDKTAVLSSLLDKAVCVSNGSDWEAQEFHANGGSLIDYKKGPTDTVDPTENVGTWQVNDNGSVTYTYSGGTSYTNTVVIDGTNICLDNGSTTTQGTIQSINIGASGSGCQ